MEKSYCINPILSREPDDAESSARQQKYVITTAFYQKHMLISGVKTPWDLWILLDRAQGPVHVHTVCVNISFELQFQTLYYHFLSSL